MKTTLRLTLMAAALISAGAAQAGATAQLRFDGLTVETNGTRPDVQVSEYYNKGQALTRDGASLPAGTPDGPALGVSVSGNWVYASEATAKGGEGAFVPVPLAPAFPANTGALTLQTDPNLDDGFTPASVLLGLSAAYADAISFLFTSLGGSGLDIQLDFTTGDPFTDSLSSLPSCADAAASCEWAAISYQFQGRTLKSVRFAGDDVALDNITLGSDNPLAFVADPKTPPEIPEPATYALMALGLGALGLGQRRRRARG